MNDDRGQVSPPNAPEVPTSIGKPAPPPPDHPVDPADFPTPAAGDLAQHTRAVANNTASTVLFTAVMLTDADELTVEGITATIDQAIDDTGNMTPGYAADGMAVKSLLLLARSQAAELEL